MKIKRLASLFLVIGIVGSLLSGSFIISVEGKAKANKLSIKGLTYISTAEKVTLKWKKIKKAAGYEIRKDNVDKRLAKYKTIRKNVKSFTDTDVFSGMTYNYSVRAYGKGKKTYSKWEDICVVVKKGKEVALTSEMKQKILSDADKRREEIRNTKTEIVKSDTYIKGKTYTGTAYYISNSGNDNNSGTSPEQALATAKGLEKIEVKSGDAIFFERGGLWRGEDIEIPWDVIQVPGLTISAYGEGPKPKLYGNEENGSGAEKWSLYYDKDGKKIWKYYKAMPDISGIDADNTVIKRDMAWWDGSNYYTLTVNKDDKPVPTQTKYTIEKELPDKHFFLNHIYPKENLDEGRVFEKDGKLVMGDFFLRCDKGNPGEIYNSMEFIGPYKLFDGCSDDAVFDNLCISYSSYTVCTGRREGYRANGVIFQNLEIGWHGGHVIKYARTREEAKKGEAFEREGGGAAINGSNCILRNSYLHHEYQESLNTETFEGDDTVSNVTIEDNLAEYCISGVALLNWEDSKTHFFKDILFRNNMVMYSGYEDLQWKPKIYRYNPCFSCGFLGGTKTLKNVRIENNVFAYTVKSGLKLQDDTPLVYLGWVRDLKSIFSGNTFIQSKGVRFIRREAAFYEQELVGFAMTARNIKKLLGDATAKVYVDKG